METYLKDLLERLADKSWTHLPNGSRTTQGSISWIAHREADDFHQLEALLPLKKLLSREKKVWIRRDILRLIINIVAKHSLDAEIDFIFERLSQEKSKYLLSGVMSKMYDYLNFNADKYANQLITYLKSSHWLIRHDAIRLLSRVQNQKVPIEQLLLTYLQNPIHTCDVRNICGTLGQIGSINSISLLKTAVLNYKDEAALYALDVLDGQNQLDFYLNLYATPRNPVIKEWLIRYISKYDAPQAIPILITRVKKLLSKIRPDSISYSDSWKPELIEIILFLKRYEAQYREIGALLGWIQREKVHFLLKDEVAWFKKQMPFPDKLYRVIVVLKEVRQKQGRNLPTNLDELKAIFTISEALRQEVLEKLLRYRYAIYDQSDNIITLKHIKEKEVYCAIASKYIVFYTTEFEIGSVFEVRQTPFELMPPTYFLIFDEQKNKWEVT